MMNTKKMIGLFAIAVCSLLNFNASAQLKVPAPSPAQTVKQSFGLGEVSVEYSRPSVKGRVIFGDVVPFGKTWRTGANASTKITFTDDVKLEGRDLKAGTYAIYSVPNKDAWDIMLYKDLSLGGNVADYKIESEVMRLKVKPSILSNKIESFTINFSDLTPTSLAIELLWENTRIAISVSADIDAKIMKNIETNVINDSRPYFQAASYYFENNKDLKQALTWASKAAEQNPKAYWMMLLKSKIEYKLNDKVAGRASAEKTIELATADKNDDYTIMAKKLIESNK